MYRKFALGGGDFAQSDTKVLLPPSPLLVTSPRPCRRPCWGNIFHQCQTRRRDQRRTSGRLAMMGRIGQLHVRSVGTCQILTPSLVSNHSGVRYSRGNVNDLDAYHWVCARVFIRQTLRCFGISLMRCRRDCVIQQRRPLVNWTTRFSYMYKPLKTVSTIRRPFRSCSVSQIILEETSGRHRTVP